LRPQFFSSQSWYRLYRVVSCSFSSSSKSLIRYQVVTSFVVVVVVVGVVGADCCFPTWTIAWIQRDGRCNRFTVLCVLCVLCVLYGSTIDHTLPIFHQSRSHSLSIVSFPLLLIPFHNTTQCKTPKPSILTWCPF